MASNLNVSAERSLFPPPATWPSSDFWSSDWRSDYPWFDFRNRSIVLLFSSLTSLQKWKTKKQKKGYLKPSQHEQKPKEGKNLVPLSYLLCGFYTQIYNSRQIDLRVRQEEKKKKNSAQTLVCSASTFRWLHIKNMALEPRVKGEASARFSEWEALKVPRWRNYFQL